jgi:hypothetical protein
MRFAHDPCPDELAFRFQNGARARSLDELRRTLATVPADVVQFHKDHFQQWVRDILLDPALAERIQAEGQRARDGEQLRRGLDQLLGASLRQAPGSGAGSAPAASAAAGAGAQAQQGRRPGRR